VLSYDGQMLNRIGSRGTGLGQFNYPTNLALDSTGRLFVSDSLNFRVQVFDADLRPVRTIGKKGDLPGYFAQPKGIALDTENHLYVLDAQFENVQLFNPMGQILMDFGEEGHGPGQFWLPPSIFINQTPSTANPANRIYIADSYNRRIQVFDYLPQPEPQAETQP
jgi:sugar lactone lactonase YvrE